MNTHSKKHKPSEYAPDLITQTWLERVSISVNCLYSFGFLSENECQEIFSKINNWYLEIKNENIFKYNNGWYCGEGYFDKYKPIIDAIEKTANNGEGEKTLV